MDLLWIGLLWIALRRRDTLLPVRSTNRAAGEGDWETISSSATIARGLEAEEKVFLPKVSQKEQRLLLERRIQLL